MIDFQAARLAMVENQLRPSRITDEGLLAAMAAVPRELFLPARLRGIAYLDEDIDLGDGQHLIEPLALAKLIQAARPGPRAAALVVGCQTGYCTAVLARLTGTVFHLVPDANAEKQVGKHLASIDCDNAIVKLGPAAQGLSEQAPFATILLAGAVTAMPGTLLAQIEDGGRAVAVLREGRSSFVQIHERVGSSIGRLRGPDAAIPSLDELREEVAFEF